MRLTSVVLGLFSVLSLAACSGAPTSAGDDSTAGAAAVTAAHQDRFLLSTPLGVKAVNEGSACTKGSGTLLCTVDRFDFDGANVTDMQAKKAEDAFQAGHALLKGQIVDEKIAGDVVTGVLKVTEVWMGRTNADVSELVGQFYQVTKTAACSRVAGAPCPEAHESLLNKSNESDIAKVDFSKLDTTVPVITDAKDAMAAGELLVAGIDVGVARTLLTLEAKEIYTKVDGANPGAALGEMCGGFAGITCKNGLVCRMSTDDVHPDQAGTCEKTDCRDTGCGEGSSCQVCWATFACIPHGALC